MTLTGLVTSGVGGGIGAAWPFDLDGETTELRRM